MRMFPLLLLLLALSVGCSTKYIVLRDVPEEPTFTVIPATVGKDDMSFASAITSAIISCGVKVVERPPLLSGYAENTGESSGVSSTSQGVAFSGGRGKGETVAQQDDVVSLYDKTTAHFVVITQERGYWIRITRRETREIQFSGTVELSRGVHDYGPTLRKILANMGVPVRH